MLLKNNINILKLARPLEKTESFFVRYKEDGLKKQWNYNYALIKLSSFERTSEFKNYYGLEVCFC